MKAAPTGKLWLQGLWAPVTVWGPENPSSPGREGHPEMAGPAGRAGQFYHFKKRVLSTVELNLGQL